MLDSYDVNENNEIEVWEEEIEDFNEVCNQPGVLQPLILCIIHFLALLQKKYYILNVAISLLLKFLYTVFMILSKPT